MLKKQNLIVIAVLLVVAGLGGAAYQFYIKEKLDEYAQNEKDLQGLESTHARMESLFGKGRKPDEVVTSVRNLVQPWAEAADSRAKYYDLSQFAAVEPIPENELAKPYYIQKVTEIVNALYNNAYTKNVSIQGVNPFFDQPRPEEMTGTSPRPEEAQQWLREVQLGSSVLQLLISHGALQINSLLPWPERTVQNVFEAHTYGVSMWIRMADLCSLIEKLQYDERTCFSLHAFRIQNPYLRIQDPPLLVEMVIVLADYKPADAQAPGADETPAAGGTGLDATQLRTLQTLRSSRRTRD